ncbi:hypothetical protein NBO_1344g0002 [Nosema bombycis CQ1]|uniref:Uncharacterized protein n=1 Tax=Nosema bombycis (strain CQ1 / CVCC 102059) TaxID=578461 RepID=R0MEQ1_NOSB1|nr:hypothetical protein NBO_1344g0002 [Nosema bombycis CQ1]|eukprot:EOB11253.1 hypothetical protein NBO_1344g0002 [Nosema bombycis CQ1]
MEILTITFMVSALYTILCSKKSSKTKNVAFACWQDCDKSEMKLRESDNSNDIESRTRRNNKTNSGCTSCNVNPFKFTEKQEKTDKPSKSSRSNKKHESVISSRVSSHKNNKFHDSRISGKVISGKNSKEPIFFPSDKNLIFVKTDKPCFKPDRIDDFCNKKDKRKCFKDCEFPTSCSSDSKSCTTDSSCISESSCSSTSSSCSSSDKVQENTGCYERIMCKENDLICKEVKKEFAITENNLLVMMNNYICNVENIIMTNVSTILDNPEKYVPLTIGAAAA